MGAPKPEKHEDDKNKNDIGKRVEDYFKNFERRADDFGDKKAEKFEKSPAGRKTGYGAIIFFSIVTLYVINNLLNWDVPFLTEAFVANLSIFNILLIVLIITNTTLLFYEPEWFRSATELVTDVLSFIAVYSLYSVFPFSASTTVETIIRVIIILVLIGIIIGTIYETVKFIRILGKPKE